MFEMDTRQDQAGWCWFRPSVERDVDDRGVLYSRATVLVPLLIDEVPFDYADLGDVVFLWDPSTGVALASARASALMVSAPVVAGKSAEALYGKQDEEPGYCYRLVTGETLDLGPYPTVESLRGAGVVDIFGVTYDAIAGGLYHCKLGDDGLLFSTLPGTAVVGGKSMSAACVLVGMVATAALSTTDMKRAFHRYCVAGAAPVDISTCIVYSPGDGSVSRDVNWFAHREIRPGMRLNMGLLPLIPGERDYTIHVVLPSDSNCLYWNSIEAGVVVTHAAMTDTGWVSMVIPPRMAGIYFYCVSVFPLPGTVQQDIKVNGLLEWQQGGKTIYLEEGDKYSAYPW